MAVSLKHTTQAVGTDAGNGEIGKNQWNEEHTLTLATGKLLGRSTAGDGAAEEVSVGTGLTLAAGSLGLGDNARTSALGYAIDGGGDVITTGLAGIGLCIPYACTITEWTLHADVSGSIVVDVWKDTYANYPPTVSDSITGSAKPTISGANRATGTALTGWTTSIAAGDILYFNVDSCATIKRAVLTLKVTKQ